MLNIIKRNFLGIVFVILGISFIFGFELRSGAGSIFTGIPKGVMCIILGIIFIWTTEKYKLWDNQNKE